MMDEIDDIKKIMSQAKKLPAKGKSCWVSSTDVGCVIYRKIVPK